MAALILLLALGTLITSSIVLSGLLTKWLPLSNNWKLLLRLLIVASVFPLMVIDEAVGKHQFESLCKRNGLENTDLSKAAGKRVRRKSSDRVYLHGSILPIKASNESILDASTNEVLVKYKDYFAGGGWLVRNTPVNMGGQTPILFHGNGCGFQLKDQIFLRHQIVQIN